MKGQGLPTSTMVLIIMSIVILVFAIIFIIIPILHTSTPTPPSTAMSSFVFNCATYCGQPASLNNIPSNTYFCTKTLDYNGTIYHCYDPYGGKPISTCSYTSQNGTVWNNLDAATCS
jgi:hypothetical protein